MQQICKILCPAALVHHRRLTAGQVSECAAFSRQASIRVAAAAVKANVEPPSHAADTVRRERYARAIFGVLRRQHWPPNLLPCAARRSKARAQGALEGQLQALTDPVIDKRRKKLAAAAAGGT